MDSETRAIKRKLREIYSMVDKVEYTHNGKVYDGTYRTLHQGQTVEVTCELGSKSTQVGGSPPHVMARMMLGEIVREAARGAK